jgi:hypothetical protein
MTALDGLGLDIEQAVISCFNGFAMDVFRAEVCGHHIITLSSDDGFIKPNLTSVTLLALLISVVSSSNAGMVLDSCLMKLRLCCCTLLVFPTQCSWSENKGLRFGSGKAVLFIGFWFK